MVVDPPYRLDPFQNIVGIHWGEISTGGEGTGGPSFKLPCDVTLQWFGANGSVMGTAPDNDPYTIPFEGTLSGSPETVGQSGHFNGFEVTIGIVTTFSALLDGILAAGPFVLDCSGMTFTGGPPSHSGEVYVPDSVTDVGFYDSGLINPSFKQWRFKIVMVLQ